MTLSFQPDQAQLKLSGILLGVHTSLGGDQLVFRYPPVYRKHLSEETQDKIKGSQGHKSDGSKKTGIESTPKNPDEKPLIAEHGSWDAYHLPSVVLCGVLCPRAANCDQIFEFMIDDQKFIGYPTTVSHKNTLPNAAMGDSILIATPTVSTAKLNMSDSSGNSSEQNTDGSGLGISHDTLPHRKDSSGSDVMNSSTGSKPSLRESQFLANDYIDSMARTSSLEQMSINNMNDHSSTVQHNTSPFTKKNKDEIAMFNIVLVVQKKAEPAITKMCYHVAEQVAAALKHEEERCKFVTNEVFKMLRIRERWLLTQTQATDENSKPDHKALTYDLIQSSSLASLMKDLFHGLRDEGNIHLRINDWINISLSTKDAEDQPLIPIRPYQTLLILDSIDLLRTLPKDASPTLKRLVEIAKPTKSFRELQNETGIPLAQLYKLAAHLVYWNKARIIDTLTKTNVYVLNPDPKCANFYFDWLTTTFQKAFPAFRLAEVLAGFAANKTLGQLVHPLASSLQREFVEVVVWLLRQDLLIQIHTFVFLLIPDPRDEDEIANENYHNTLYNNNNDNTTTTNTNEDGFDEEVFQNAPYLLSPAGLKAHESDYIEKLNDNSPEYGLFKRLCPYFRGFHHLEEIMWRENVSRDDITKVLKKYQHILVLVHHEGFDQQNLS
jgi:hypothetical protein